MSVSDYSTTAASNAAISGIDITGTTGKVRDGDNAIRQLMADLASYTRRGSDLASAATLDLDSVDSLWLDITGTTGISAVTLTNGHVRFCRVVSGFTVTLSASLIGQGFSTGTLSIPAGATLIFEGYSGGVVKFDWMTPVTDGTSTPTVTASSGTITTSSCTLSWTKIGRFVNCGISLTVTTNGTGAGFLQVPLPFAATTLSIGGSARNNSVSGVTCIISSHDANNAAVRAPDGSYPITGNGQTITGNFSYKASGY